MKKRFIFIGIILTTLIAAVFLITSKKGSELAKHEPRRQIAGVAQQLYDEAVKLAGEGKLLKAGSVYKKLLAQYPETDFVKKAGKNLDELNIKILFSPIPTEDSIFYEVKPGDTLSKIAREHGTTVELIMKSNNLPNTIIRPRMRLKISGAKYAILVDKSQNILMLKTDNEILKTYTVSTGADNSTPTGTFKIENKLIDPTWYKAGAVVPSGSPDNILGTRWMGITAVGYGIHGTTDESTIGQHITAGCVRMRNKEVEELYSIVPVGTEATIID